MQRGKTCRTDSWKLTAHEPEVAVIVVNWNGWRDTLECLRSLRVAKHSNYTLVLVDNYSWDDSVEQIRKFCADSPNVPFRLVEYTKLEALAGGNAIKNPDPKPAEYVQRLVLIHNDENLGHPGGVNLAVEYLAAAPNPPDYIYLLDNDATIEENCLTELVKLEQRLNCGVVGGIVHDPETHSVQWSLRGTLLGQFFPHLVREKPGLDAGESFWPSSWLAGPSILIRWDLAQGIRSRRGTLLHPGLIMHGWELEFAQSCWRAGYQPFATKDAVVYHKKRRAFGGAQSPMRYYYDARNRILLARQLLPFRWRAVFHAYNLTHTFLRIVKVLRSKRPDIAHAIAVGLVDGIRGIEGKWQEHDKEVVHPA